MTSCRSSRVGRSVLVGGLDGGATASATVGHAVRGAGRGRAPGRRRSRARGVEGRTRRCSEAVGELAVSQVRRPRRRGHPRGGPAPAWTDEEGGGGDRGGDRERDGSTQPGRLESFMVPSSLRQRGRTACAGQPRCIPRQRWCSRRVEAGVPARTGSLPCPRLRVSAGFGPAFPTSGVCGADPGGCGERSLTPSGARTHLGPATR